MGLLERHGPDGHSRVRVKHVANTRRGTLAPEVRMHVEPGANVYTDALKSYDGLSDAYAHAVIDHAEAYVRGNVHTNGLENFWSLLKRAIKGTYVSVEPFHLFRYLDEEAYRFNTRKAKDGARFVDTLHLQKPDWQVAACYDVRVSPGSGGANAMKSDPDTAQEPTPWERFVDLARKVVQTPKSEIDKRELAWRDERKKRKRRE